MIQPGTKVTLTIEATFLTENNGGYVHVAYGKDNEHTMVITPFDLRNGVTVTAAR